MVYRSLQRIGREQEDPLSYEEQLVTDGAILSAQVI
jgi:hypothetical protein